MKVRYKKLRDDAIAPQKAHDDDAGFDMVAMVRYPDEYGNMVYGTGIALEIPKGYVGMLFPRSSISKKNLALSNSVGLVDAGYRGEVLAKFKPTSNGDLQQDFTTDKTYHCGERIVQLVIMPIPDIELEEADELTVTARGDGGYGSTGK